MSTPTLAELVERQLRVAALSGEVDAVMQGIVERLLELPGADGASLSPVDGELVSFRVCLGSEATLLGKAFQLSETLGAECARTGELQVLRAENGGELAESLTSGAGTLVLAPLVYDGATRGILGVRSADSKAFTDAEVGTVRMLAHAAAIALRNAELVDRLERSEHEYRQLHDQAPDAMLLSDDGGRVLDANRAAAELFDYPVDELRTMNLTDLLAPGDGKRFPRRRRELRARRSLRGERRLVRKDRSIIEVEYSERMLDDGRVHTTMRDVTDRKREEERLHEALRRLRAVVETQQEIAELELDHDAVTRTIVERTRQLTGADGVSLKIIQGDELVSRFGAGIARDHLGLRLKRDASLSGQATLSNETVYSPDTQADPRVDAQAAARNGVSSLICAPLNRGDQVIGALVVMSRKVHAFDDLAVETTRSMAEFVSSVMRNADELDSRRQLAEQLRTQSQIVEHMQTAVLLWAPVEEGLFRLDYMNAAAEEWMRRPAGELIGKTLPEVLPAYHEEVVRAMSEVLESGVGRDLGEVEYGDEQIKSGLLSLKVFPVPGDRVAVSFENVTERVRATRALQESESRFRSAFDSTSVGMALTSLNGDFVQVNDRLADILGYSVEELAHLNSTQLVHPDDLVATRALDVELLAGKRAAYRLEQRALRHDGSDVWVRTSVALAHDYEGEPVHFVSHVEDITSRKDAEALFASVFERSVVPKLVIDDDGRLVEINEAGARLLGVLRHEAIGLSVDDLIPEVEVAKYWSRFLEAGTFRTEATLHRPDGGTREIEFVGTANVQPGRHIAVALDLTAQKALEDQLRQAQKMEAVGRLAGGVAHDFNNLLTAIAGYSEFLIEGIDDEHLRLHAEEISRAAARAASLTGQLLAFSRRQVLQPRVLDLNAVVSDMHMMLQRLIGEDIELASSLAPDLGLVRADPTQIEQVIVNLAVNAREAMPGGGSLTIETSNIETDEGELVELRLADTGVGLTDAQRQTLFDPFFTTKEGGTGLGLATVHGIVEQSGGTIEVDSEPGLGASFRICLPRVHDRVVQPVTAEQLSPALGGTETILLVEDEAIVRQLVAEILERSGYTVLRAGDGPSALELLRRHRGPVDLLVTDVVMPGMSGREVAQAVTSMRPETQVLYTSGYTDSAIDQHGVLEEGLAFLQKPFSPNDLARKVRGLLDAATA